MNNKPEKFIGFPNNPQKGDFWMYPTVMDNYWKYLNGSEQKVLDFILRHTWGFRKSNDQISLSQLESGVGKLNKGTGLTRPTIIKAIKGLVDKKFIEKLERKRSNEYKLIVKKINQTSKEYLPINSKDNLHTIDRSTTNNNTINNSLYFSNKKNSLRPFYMGEEMRMKNGKWWVIPREGGPWCEYVGKLEKIEWK